MLIQQMLAHSHRSYKRQTTLYILFCLELAPVTCLSLYSLLEALESTPPIRPQPGRGTTMQVILSSLLIVQRRRQYTCWSERARTDEVRRAASSEGGGSRNERV
jgi:hypothetical protein